MPATSAVAVLETATALPVTILTRTQQFVHNQSTVPIYVSTSNTVDASTGTGIIIAANTTLLVPSGAPLWASAGSAQSGGLDSQTVVMELE